MPIEVERGLKEIRYGITATVAERLIPPLRLKVINEATLDTAKDMDFSHGNYVESANHYFSVFERSSDRSEKLEALFGLTQQLINLGRFGQARKYLGQVDGIALSDPLNEKLGVLGIVRKNEKLGWIADYEGDFEKAILYFESARTLIDGVGVIPDEPDEAEKKVYSTATHFLGRAYFGLGNYHKAIEYFNEHLESTELNLDERGFGHAWLARCYIAGGDMKMASEEIKNTRLMFDEFLINKPERGTMAHYYMLNGEFMLKKGEFGKARDQFELALGVHLKNERYPRGESRAMLAIALSYWAEGKHGAAFSYALKGIKTYPLSLIKP